MNATQGDQKIIEREWQYLHAIMENSRDFMAVLDLEGRIVYLNPGGTHLIGLTSPDEALGKTLRDFYPPEEIQRLKAARGEDLLTSIETGKWDGEARFQTLDGRLITIDQTVFLIRDEQGSGQNIGIILRDITERKQAEKKLHESQQLLQTIVDSLPICVFWKDLDSVFMGCNEPHARELGLASAAEIVGRNDFEFYPEQDAKAYRADDAEVMRNRSPKLGIEEPLVSANGVQHWIQTSKVPMYDENNNVRGTAGFYVDITQRKQLELELLRQNAILQNSRDLIAMTDYQGQLVYLNPTGARMIEVSSPQEVVGKHIAIFHTQEDANRVRQEAIPAAVANGSWRGENRLQTASDGRLIPVDQTIFVIRDEKNELQYFATVMVDITQRKEAEHQIQEQNEMLVKSNRELAIARRKADEANRLKSQFLATMSHELRTPLNAIIGYSDIVLAGMTGELTQEQTDYQRRIMVNAEHLLGLINDILDLAKIEAGRMEIVQKPFNVRQWLDQIVLQTQSLATESGLQFEARVDDRLPEALVGDAGRLKQVMLNLLSNAFKFTTAGSVKIELRLNSKHSWTINVIDTGIGISPTMLETIFDEFRQVDGGSNRKHSGTGLGLAIVRRFVLAMGGNIKVRSVVGKGSTFTIFLPLIEKSPEDSSEDQNAKIQGWHKGE